MFFKTKMLFEPISPISNYRIHNFLEYSSSMMLMALNYKVIAQICALSFFDISSNQEFDENL